MSYTNPRYENRLLLIDCLSDAFACLHVSGATSGSNAQELEGDPTRVFYQVDEVGGEGSRNLFNFPYLLHANGEPWHEANDYLLSLMRDKAPVNLRTDDVRRRASKLLDYLLYCEDNDLDWLDFSGVRPSLRPTYKYFYHLINDGARSNQVVNQYTSVVYQFYKYIAEHWHVLDMKRVDTVKQVKILVETRRGTKIVDAEKRSQTRRSAPPKPVPLGFVREDGEDLRPLSNIELRVFLETIGSEAEWSTVERLILFSSLMTGARKQSVLTIRLKHLEEFAEGRLRNDATYELRAGPRTGIDTKFDKPQTLYFPKQLADELTTLARSPLMKSRRAKFKSRLSAEYPGLIMDERDIYLFLSDQGNTYYMATSDPRYQVVKSPQAGQVTDTIKRKLVDRTPDSFPKDFTYHWLRATFAYQLYQRLQILVKNGALKPGEDIDFIQHRMHHESRQTTENYLKLFKMIQEKVIAQEIWEQALFTGGYDSLVLEVQD